VCSSTDSDGPLRIRVLLANVSGLVAEIIGAQVADHPDIELLGVVQGQIETLLAAHEQVDVLVLGASQVYPPPGLTSHLLSEYPALRIMAISLSGDRGALYWLGLRRRRLPIVTARSLPALIRRAYALNPTGD
jgi:hypothetical protein